MTFSSPALAAPPQIKLRDLYNKDMSFSDFANAHDGKDILVNGFMAPPLKAESKFFVLTKMPMAVCPFCEPETDWPDDILAVYARRTVDVIPFNRKIIAQGRLKLGGYSDPEPGFTAWSGSKTPNTSGYRPWGHFSSVSETLL